MAKRAPKAPRLIESKPLPARAVEPAPRLADILGQDRALGALRPVIRSGRIHHAWVFHGPQGVGKFTTALAFAALILDPTSSAGLSGEIEPDSASTTQHMIATGTHPDLHVIRKELGKVSRDTRVREQMHTNIAKAVLEQFLVEPAARTRVVPGASLVAKVFIVDEAELVDSVGQNLLLKTLEEPPLGTVLVLVTSAPERLLPTIRSRCQPVPFAPLDEASMKAWMSRAARTLPALGALDAPTRDWLLSFAAGSPGVVSLAVSTGLHLWHGALAPMLRELDGGDFPLDLAPTMATLVDEWAKAWAESHENASKEAANKAGARHMFALLAEHLGRALRTARGSASGESSVRAIDLLARAESQVAANVQVPFVLDNLVAQLAQGAG